MSAGVIVMWAHSRSASTAFLRMMLERGDVAVLHEPFLALTEEGEVAVPAPDGGRATARSQEELLARLTELGRTRPVFVKEVVDYEYAFPRERLAALTHTFIVRDPKQTISSHYAVKPAVTCAEIGYERLYALFEVVRSAAGRVPLVIRAERLVDDPETVVRAFCAYTGLPFLPESLAWEAGERPEWRRTREWHVDASHSTGFTNHRNAYPVTVDNDTTLKSFYDHHLPFYERLVQHAF
ncbi:sulfotransferase [Actinoallomurus rhizosphaericola]|uniref:sulfotransferase n=1 Tax=Actinoallomurus rhizosphaericola TaxID=2952536 RepID=UPI0020932ACA|nr:sulfotransferase [Actinoallomurus rhizosphaericola]MCO5995521.1 sulfotransferase [Actinoallomurus rhizosphaericola]